MIPTSSSLGKHACVKTIGSKCLEAETFSEIVILRKKPKWIDNQRQGYLRSEHRKLLNVQLIPGNEEQTSFSPFLNGRK